MPKYNFEAMDAQGHEIGDTIEASTEGEAQETIRQMGYFVTRINLVTEENSDETGNEETIFSSCKELELSLIHIPSPRDRTRSRMPSSA